MSRSDITESDVTQSGMKELWQSAHEKFFLSALEAVASQLDLKSQLNSNFASSREALADFLDSKHGQHQGLFPDRKTEDWKYTGLSDLEGFVPRLAPALPGGGATEDFPSWIGSVAARLGIQPDRIQSDPLLFTITFRPGEGARMLHALGSRGGIVNPAVTLKSGVTGSDDKNHKGVRKSKSSLWGAAFEALHTAFTPFCNCITIKRSPDNQIPTVLIIEDLAALPDEQFTAAQWSINLQEGASAQIIRVQTDGRGEEALRVIKTDINLAARAECSLLLVQESTQGSHAICLTQTRVAANALFKSLTLSSSTGLIRNQLDIALSGERAAAQFDGYYHPKEKGHIDNFSTVTHRVGNTTSNQLYKGLLEDSGHGVFRGIVKIDTGADGSAAHQLNRSILLGAGAQVDTKPELRIDADEVSCSHGASVGPLSEDEIFYLQSRALSRSEALAMMCKGFVEELASRDIPAQISTCYLNWLRNEVLPTVQELQ
jgi:hypothetical protein